MKKLINQIKVLKKSKIKTLIDSRIAEFKALGKKSSIKLFNELCYCLLTANFNAERSISIQKNIGSGFLSLSKEKLAQKLRALGHRFPNARASYIAEARKHLNDLTNLKKLVNPRKWLVKNVKGLGYKEASHFLRNIGFGNFAIIDFHIIDLLARNGLIRKQEAKTLTKNKYLEIENLLKKLAKKLNLSLAELDLYLWFIETGKILK